MNKIKVPKKAKIIVFANPYMLELVRIGGMIQPKANVKIDPTNKKGVFRVARTLKTGKRLVEYVKIK